MKEHWAQWFPHSLMRLLASEIFSLISSENQSNNEITVNEIHFADYNTHLFLGYSVYCHQPLSQLLWKEC